jgi:hypothetical protein
VVEYQMFEKQFQARFRLRIVWGMLHSVKGIDPKDAKSLVAIFDRQTKEREGEFPEGFHSIGRHERDDAADGDTCLPRDE